MKRTLAKTPFHLSRLLLNKIAIEGRPYGNDSAALMNRMLAPRPQ